MADLIIRVYVDDKTLWNNVAGSGWYNYPWWYSALYNGAEIGDMNVTIQDPEDETKTISKIVTFEEIVRAFERYLQFNDITVDRIDEAVADEIMQIAVFGETMFG